MIFVQFGTETVPEAGVLHVTGEVDLATAPLLVNAIAGIYCEHRCIIVDLSRLDYLDGSGIRVLETTAAANRGRFVVVGSKPTIHRLFDLLELRDVLPVVPSVEAARNYLQAQRDQQPSPTTIAAERKAAVS